MARKPFLLRISAELYAELESWAAQEMRSVNGQIEWILREAVHRRRPPKEQRESDAPVGGDDEVGDEDANGKRG